MMKISQEERKKLVKAVRRQMREINIGESPAHFGYYNMLVQLLKIYSKKSISCEDIEKIKQLYKENKDNIAVVNRSKLIF